MKLIEHFTLTKTEETTYRWALANHDVSKSAEDELAENLAMKIMENRLIGCPQHLAAWNEKFNNNTPLAASSRLAIIAFTKSAFGLPETPEIVNIDHLEGLISQYLWYFLYLEFSEEPIIHRASPGFKATDPGGDAFFVHQLDNGNLMFRLWEIKKFIQRTKDSTSSAKATINTAYEQLESKATEYLARYTSIAQELNPELQDFFGKLIEYWIDATPEASAGVALNTSEHLVPPDNFRDFGNRFPKLTNPIRLQGMISSVQDFSAFSLKVRENIWKGL